MPGGVVVTAPGGAASGAEHQADELAEAEVERGHQRHHHRDEHDDDERVVPQLGARGPDDLAQLVEDLADEQAQRPEPPGDGVAAPLLAPWRGGRESWSDPRQSRCLFTSSCCRSVALRAARPRRQPARSGCSRGRTTRATQGRRDSNPQPPVLETGALPIEPLPYGAPGREGLRSVRPSPSGTPKAGGHTERQAYGTARPGANPPVRGLSPARGSPAPPAGDRRSRDQLDRRARARSATIGE